MVSAANFVLKHPIYCKMKLAGWRCHFGPYTSHADI
jgi:hypothetical protein